MRILVCLALAGCFEDQSTPRDASAVVLVDSLAAFADIQANLTTDPAKAGEALTKFMRAPVAAGALLDQPFDPAVVNTTRIPAPASIPACLDTTGTTGCDGFTTNAECEAGPFRFTGTASRTCHPACTDVTGTCDYTWDLTLHEGTDQFVIDLETATLAPVTADTSHLTIDTTLSYQVTIGAFTETGNVRVCSCGAINLNAEHVPVSSSLVVKDVTAPARCALVELDAGGQPTITPACTCADGGCL